MEEIRALIEAHLKESINLTLWSQEYFKAEKNERLILYELGIYELLVNNSWPRLSPNP